MIFMKNFLLGLFLSATSFANIIIPKEGCYELEGQVQKLSGHTLELKLLGHTRSEEKANIILNPLPINAPRPGSWIRIMARTQETGKLPRLLWLGSSASIKVLSAREVNYRKPIAESAEKGACL